MLLKKKRFLSILFDDTEVSSDSDRENFNDKNYNEENFREESLKKANKTFFYNFFVCT